MMKLRAWWSRLFLEERPSVSLSLFRIAVAITVGCHMIPSLLELSDNYLPATAFKELNPSFFPLWALRLVQASPAWVVFACVGLFALAWCCFFIGLRAQLSCLVMTASCYYFYALNSLHIGTLSFDILLVTLSLMWVTNYHGDWLSVDSVLRGDPAGYTRLRPFFIQRLLQLQIAWTFWYTALRKITIDGNWLTDNPYYYLMPYPPMGVVRDFPFRPWLAQHPGLCYAIGIGVMIGEFSLPVLLWIRKTRGFGLALGMLFHVLLLVTLHVPTIFFFLFPPQLCLFIDPERIVDWIDHRRALQAKRGRGTLLYDGRCGFCQASVKRLVAMDPFGYLDPVDFHTVPDLARLHPSLTSERCHSRMQLIAPSGRLSEGFFVVRRLSLKLPMLWPLSPWFFLPGSGWIGQRVYDWVARHRYLFHVSRSCKTNQCAVSTDSPNA